MGYSVTEHTYVSGPQEFDLNFTLGYIAQTDVSVYVVDELDGLGNQLFRVFDFITDNRIRVLGDIPANSTVICQRTVSKTSLPVDLTSVGAATRENLDLAVRYTMLAFHELFDGRLADTATIGGAPQGTSRTFAELGIVTGEGISAAERASNTAILQTVKKDVTNNLYVVDDPNEQTIECDALTIEFNSALVANTEFAGEIHAEATTLRIFGSGGLINFTSPTGDNGWISPRWYYGDIKAGDTSHGNIINYDGPEVRLYNAVFSANNWVLLDPSASAFYFRCEYNRASTNIEGQVVGCQVRFDRIQGANSGPTTPPIKCKTTRAMITHMNFTSASASDARIDLRHALVPAIEFLNDSYDGEGAPVSIRVENLYVEQPAAEAMVFQAIHGLRLINVIIWDISPSVALVGTGLVKLDKYTPTAINPNNGLVYGEQFCRHVTIENYRRPAHRDRVGEASTVPDFAGSGALEVTITAAGGHINDPAWIDVTNFQGTATGCAYATFVGMHRDFSRFDASEIYTGGLVRGKGFLPAFGPGNSINTDGTLSNGWGLYGSVMRITGKDNGSGTVVPAAGAEILTLPDAPDSQSGWHGYIYMADSTDHCIINSQTLNSQVTLDQDYVIGRGVALHIVYTGSTGQWVAVGPVNV